MKIVADLHIHSHFSRATSQELTFEHLARWAQLKGVQVVGTGDITHPGWLSEMRETLIPAEDGLFQLKDEVAAAVQETVPPACQGPVRFILAGEISNIYKRDEQTRKVHNLVFAPDFQAVERLQASLDRIGNIRADGRPILGLDSRDLLEITLETDPRCHLIPAHIWTPWFSLLGSKSGFDSVEACFADLTPHIFALETGLSSDPPMNWRVSALDRYALVSNSDAHSPQKLAREATLFDCELAYGALFDALRTSSPPSPLLTTSPPTPLLAGEGSQTPPSLAGKGAGGLGGTIEFFPEEGKYHFDGHRKCSIVWDPATTLAHAGICPTCGKPVTVGVMHRVETLADRPAGLRPPHAGPFTSLIPLPEILGEVYGVGAGSKQVEAAYTKLLDRLGPELAILQKFPLEEIAAVGGERLAEGIGRMRRGEVVAEAGYDGEFGVIRVFAAAARVSAAQMGLFGEEENRGQESGIRSQKAEAREQDGENGEGVASDLVMQEAVAEYATAETAPTPGLAPLDTLLGAVQSAADSIPNTQSRPSPLVGLNNEQRAAVLCTDRPLVIVAGPGTGKTRTLTVRIAYLILEKGVAPESILAITFTNKAAGEMRERLTALLDAPRPARFGETSKVSLADRVTIKTFHALGAGLLREHAGRLGLSPDFVILSDEDRGSLLKMACPELTQAEVVAYLTQISEAKAVRLGGGQWEDGRRLKSAADTRSLLKQTGVEPPQSASADLAHQAAVSTADPFADIYHRYEAALRAGDAVDFDDLILLPVHLFEAHPDVLAVVQARYRWISVDEYQDVNLAQYRLLRLLTAPPTPQSWGEQSHPPTPRPWEAQSRPASAQPWEEQSHPPTPQSWGEQSHPPELGGRGANLCVIGDPDQAIYGFRGADPRYFLQFEQDYPGAVTLSLNRNYRSSQRILDAAMQVIAKNPDRKAVQILAEFADEIKLDIHRAPTDKAEAEYVVHQIEQMVGGVSYFSIDSARVTGETPAAARSFGDFAVLYRLGAQSRLLIEAFDRSGIPYQAVGQTPLYAHKAVREVLAWLWLLHNPYSQVHLDVVLATGKAAVMVRDLRELGELGELKELRELRELEGAQGNALVDALEAAAASERFSAAQRKRLAGLAALWRQLEHDRGTKPVAQLVEQVAAFVAGQPGEPLSDADAERLRQLARRAVPFENRLSDFLEATALQSETDAYDPRADRVTLMTLHAAKGLEFPVVFIVGCEEGLLPYVRVARSETLRADPQDEAGHSNVMDLEEERRLFYVGLTRAGQKLILTHARTRFLFGQRMENPASRFVSDIEDAFKEVRAMQYRPPERKPESGQMRLF